MAAAGAAAVRTAAVAASSPACAGRRKPWRHPAVRGDAGEGDSDMTDVGLDDVFSLIAQAQEAFPDGRPPEELVAADTTTTTTSSRARRSTPASRWYSVYGRSVVPSKDARSVFYGPRRPVWPGPVPAHLKGEFPGDAGVDPLGLCRDPAAFARLRASEVMHGRWAMLGAACCLIPELGQGSDWVRAVQDHFVIGGPGVGEVVLGLVLVVAELGRAVGADGLDSLYPGSKAFDPLGFATDAESFAELKVKEVKNGRLAMVAMAGLFAQAAVSGVGPVHNLRDFLQF